jgi:hypothetical protein
MQLVFCLACLSMTAWTWMRYSYRWDLPIKRYGRDTDQLRKGRWPDGLLVRYSNEWGPCEGRVGVAAMYDFDLGRPIHVLQVTTPASRFHGASVAGLIVGAMGCFIFGLYLRRWLIERKALASQPRRDMIA